MPKAPKATARGEVRMGPHVLRADFNALCDFEEAAGKPITALDLSGDVSFRDVRALVQALGRFGSAQEAGDAIQAVGLQAAATAVGAAVEAGLGTGGNASRSDAAQGDEPGEG